MKSYFNKEFFVSNRRHLRELCKETDLIIVTANALLQRNSDNTYRFRQDSNFWYLTGIETNEAILVISRNKEYIILPNQEHYQRIFDGPILEKEVTLKSGIEDVVAEKDGWRSLKATLKRKKHVATITPSPAYIDHYKFYTNPARANLVQKIQAINPNIAIVDIRPHLTDMRMIKQAPELKTINAAIAITNQTLKEIKQNLARYVYEYEIEADLTYGFRRRGAHGHAFHPIIAGGKNACILHYFANSDNLKAARFVLFDVGAELDNYAADISATFWSTIPTKRETEVYEAVLAVQTYIYSVMKPGALIKEYEKQVEQFMGEQLYKLGLIKTMEREAIRQYFPHAASHHLGLDAHDIADYKRPLEQNMVLAAEAGIYIQEEGIGVRIEDNVAITQTGNKILSADLPRALA